MKIKKRDLLVLIESYVNEQALDLELPTSDKTPASEQQIKTAINDLAYFYDRAKDLKVFLRNQISSLESSFGTIQTMTLDNIASVKSVMSNLPGTEGMMNQLDSALAIMKKIDSAISGFESLFASPIDSKKWAKGIVEKYMVNPERFANQPDMSRLLNSFRLLGESLGLIVDAFKGMIRIYNKSTMPNPNTNKDEPSGLLFLFNMLILLPKALLDINMQEQLLTENISFLKEVFPEHPQVLGLVKLMEELLRANQEVKKLGSSLSNISFSSNRDAKTQERFNDDYEVGF